MSSKMMGLQLANRCSLSDHGLILTHCDRDHFPDDIFKWIFLFEKVGFLTKIQLKFVSRSKINNIPALVQIMAWRRAGDKPLSEPMMVRLLIHMSHSASIGGLPMCVLSYIFAWHRGSSGQRPWVRLLHSLVHCHLARLCEDLFSSGMRPWTV